MVLSSHDLCTRVLAFMLHNHKLYFLFSYFCLDGFQYYYSYLCLYSCTGPLSWTKCNKAISCIIYNKRRFNVHYSWQQTKKIFFFVVYVKFYLFHSILFLHFIILWPTKMLFVPLKTLEPYTKWAHLMSLLYLNNCCWERNKVRQVDGRSRSSKIIFFIDIIYYTLRLLWFLPASACSFLCHNWMSASFNQSQVVGFSSYTKLIKRVCNGLCVCVCV